MRLLTDGRGCEKVPLPKISHTYPTTINVGTVIPYVKCIQKIHTIIYMVTIFMMTAKIAILGLLKIKVFLMKVYDVIFFFYDLTESFKTIQRDQNFSMCCICPPRTLTCSSCSTYYRCISCNQPHKENITSDIDHVQLEKVPSAYLFAQKAVLGNVYLLPKPNGIYIYIFLCSTKHFLLLAISVCSY